MNHLWNRRQFLRQTVAGVAGGTALGAAMQTAWAQGGPAGGGKGAKPNFVIIMADDMGFSDAGCYGGDVKTPTLDSLAAGGIRFTQCYSTARCWPSRTCLLTGYYAQQVRADPQRGGVPDWAPLLSARLKEQGYRSYHSGKWHIIGKKSGDTFDRSLTANDHDHFHNPGGLQLDGKAVKASEDGRATYLTTVIADHGIDFLKEHADKHKDSPFFLYLAFTCPHFPLHALKEDIEKYKDRYGEGWDVMRRKRWQRLREMGIVSCEMPALDGDVVPGWNLSEDKLRERIGPGEAGHAVPWDRLTDAQKAFQARKMAIHAAMIDRMDQEVARVVAQLKAMGQFENTIVVFLSDNGASAEQIIRGSGHDPAAEPGSAGSYLCLGPGWSSAANTPFRLHKSWVHEGGCSSPCIVHWPAGIRARGELRRTVCHFIDVVPTALDLAGVRQRECEGAPKLPGRSLRPAFDQDKPLPFDYIFFHHIGNRAIRVGDWKIVAKGKDPWELYDLKSDRCEMKDLAAGQPQRVTEMAELWERCEKEFNAAAPSVPRGPKKTPRKKD